MNKTLKECKVTDAKIKLLNKIGITDSDSMLSYYPFRYDEIKIVPYTEWKKGEQVVFRGKLISNPSSYRLRGKLSISKFTVLTDDETISVTIFNRPWINRLKLEQELTIFGRYDGNQKVTASNYNALPLEEQLGIKPVYYLKEGLTQKIISDNVKKCFDAVNNIDNIVPQTYIDKYRLLNRSNSIKMIHFPSSMEEVNAARRTLKYEEFLIFHTAIALMKKSNNQNEETGIGKKFDVDEVFALANRLSFSLTNDQLKVTNQIIEDLQSNKIMYRLVQGDVGCGKTLVAALSLYACVLSHHQAAFLAPTEILAKQHYKTLKDLFKITNLKIEVLYSSLNSAKKKEILERLKDGDIDILIGTHAIFQDNVTFNDLGLVVADEQHRFGVEQRRKLIEKGDKVDILLMSATPIPRTLANTIYGDMDVSTILTMPKGRKEVKTYLIKENSFTPVYKEIVNKIKNGEQVYIVCSAIEKSEGIDVRNVNDIYKNIKIAFDGICKVGILHGKMSAEDKDAVMDDFAKNKIQVLVSTTVIEVGVNVVNATCMIIYDADRFGLSQLHQLRGRVQRGSKEGSCYLLTNKDDETSLKRLEVLVKTTNGFDISLEDLRLRGPGDILGTRQSGIPSFIIGNLIDDSKIVNIAKEDAAIIVANSDNKENANIINKAKSMYETYFD